MCRGWETGPTSLGVIMFIESLIKRKKGSTVTLGQNTYLFNDANNHTCEVVDENHINLLLGIPKGYQAADQAEESTAADDEQTESREELVALYVAKFGKAPHPRAGIAKIKAELGSE